MVYFRHGAVSWGVVTGRVVTGQADLLRGEANGGPGKRQRGRESVADMR